MTFGELLEFKFNIPAQNSYSAESYSAKCKAYSDQQSNPKVLSRKLKVSFILLIVRISRFAYEFSNIIGCYFNKIGR